MIVAWRNGTPVRLEQLATVIDSVEDNKVEGWFNNKRAVILAVQRQPGTNTVQIVDSILRAFAAVPAVRFRRPSICRSRSTPRSRFAHRFMMSNSRLF